MLKTAFFKGDGPCRFKVFCGEPAIREAKLQSEVAEFLSCSEDEMEAMFGDHVKVVIYRDGSVKTEACEHD